MDAQTSMSMSAFEPGPLSPSLGLGPPRLPSKSSTELKYFVGRWRTLECNVTPSNRIA